MSEPYEYETEYGTLRAFVHAAETRRHHEFVAGWVAEEFPVLIISSKPDLRYDSRGWLRYRGRDYLIETGYRFESGSWLGASETYTQGAKRRLNEAGDVTAVEFRSGPGRFVYGLAKEARDAFVTAHPEWIIDSMIMRREHERDKAERDREYAEQEAKTHAASAGRLEREIAALREQYWA